MWQLSNPVIGSGYVWSERFNKAVRCFDHAQITGTKPDGRTVYFCGKHTKSRQEWTNVRYRMEPCLES